MFEILELPKEEVKEVEQFIPLEQVAELKTETVDTFSKQDYDSLAKTLEEIKSLITTKE